MVNQDIKQFLPSQIKYYSKEDRQHTYIQELSAISSMQKLKQKKDEDKMGDGWETHTIKLKVLRKALDQKLERYKRKVMKRNI